VGVSKWLETGASAQIFGRERTIELLCAREGWGIVRSRERDDNSIILGGKVERRFL